MSKKKIIFPDSQPASSVLGLASNERIWKLCWAINQKLGIELATESDGIRRIEGPENYQDTHSDPDFEFILIENDPKLIKTTKVAQQFRFLLAIRNKRQEGPDLVSIIEKLRALVIVSLVQDLSSEKDIQSILP